MGCQKDKKKKKTGKYECKKCGALTDKKDKLCKPKKVKKEK